MMGKYIKANLIDLGIPLFPVIISYYYKNLVIFEYLGFFELLAIIYLIFTLISIIGNKGNTIGNNLSKIYLIDVKTEKVNFLKNLLRILLITVLIFLIGDIKNPDITTFILFILVILPIPIIKKDKITLSLLNASLGLSYKQL